MIDTYNKLIDHPLQAFEWAEFRKKTGVKVVRGTNFQLTVHKIPCLPAGKAHAPWTIGYFPKGPVPTKKMIAELKEIGKQENCIFIQLEPNIQKNKIGNSRLRRAAHPLFTKYTFWLDLTKTEEELFKNMSAKTRYNIRVAQKHGVVVVEDNSDVAFEEYLRLTQETIKRQKFYAHNEEYHRLMWETLKPKMENGKWKMENNKLTAHLLLAKHENKTLVAWMLFAFKDTLYYPYGASSSEHREVMASNLMLWEAIKWGKRLGLKKFDLWGALGPKPDKNDSWYGFHRFKEGYGGRLIEFVGSYDLVINPFLYQIYKIVDKIRWLFLKLV